MIAALGKTANTMWYPVTRASAAAPASPGMLRSALGKLAGLAWPIVLPFCGAIALHKAVSRGLVARSRPWSQQHRDRRALQAANALLVDWGLWHTWRSQGMARGMGLAVVAACSCELAYVSGADANVLLRGWLANAEARRREDQRGLSKNPPHSPGRGADPPPPLIQSLPEFQAFARKLHRGERRSEVRVGFRTRRECSWYIWICMRRAFHTVAFHAGHLQERRCAMCSASYACVMNMPCGPSSFTENASCLGEQPLLNPQANPGSLYRSGKSN